MIRRDFSLFNSVSEASYFVSRIMLERGISFVLDSLAATEKNIENLARRG